VGSPRKRPRTFYALFGALERVIFFRYNCGVTITRVAKGKAIFFIFFFVAAAACPHNRLDVQSLQQA
jgi:hypothetical protein